MAKKPKLEIPDQHLFHREMRGVVPLKAAITTDSKAPRSSNQKLRENKISINANLGISSSPGTYSDNDNEDTSSHYKEGVQKRILQKLKRGQFQVEHELDLHHMNLKTAQAALLEFIAGTQHGKIECVRVIHGKGLRSANGPRLKLMTRQILRDHPQVMAYTTCKPAHGGSGAVEALLKSV